MSRNIFVVTTALILAITVAVAAHPLETVPPSHWAYPALRHLAGLGLIPFRTLAHLPLTRGEIATLVRAAEQASSARSLPAGARDLLTALQREFLPGAQTVPFRVTARGASSRTSLTAYPSLAPGSFLGAGAGVGGPAGVAWVEGGLGPAGGQLIRAYGIARFGEVYLQIGRDLQHWSPSPRSSLLLSELGGGVDMARLVLDTGRFRFTKFVSPLLPGGRTVYLVGTRLDWQATERFRIGFSESILTHSGRMLAYALFDPLPVLLTQALDPVRLQVRYLRQPANFLGAVDFDWLLRPGLKLAGQLLVDDFSSTGNRPHRLGALLAMTWADPFRNGRTSLRVEYSAVLNYTYTDMVIPRFNYLLPGGRFLGYWLGNDADDLIVELHHVLGPTATLSGWIARTRHGAGRIGQPFAPGSAAFRRTFLSGIVESRLAVGAEYTTYGTARTARYWIEIGAVQNQNNKGGRNATDVLLGFELSW